MADYRRTLRFFERERARPPLLVLAVALVLAAGLALAVVLAP